MGSLGEAIASRFLEENGLAVVARNLDVGFGEIDLVAVDGAQRVVVEVRTRLAPSDPIDAADHKKRRHVAALTTRLGASRADFIGVGLTETGVDIHWVPGRC